MDNKHYRKKKMIMIVTRVPPFDRYSGGRTYILDFIKQMKKAGFQIEVLSLRQSKRSLYFIPAWFWVLCNIHIMNYSTINRIAIRNKTYLDIIMSTLIGSIYYFISKSKKSKYLSDSSKLLKRLNIILGDVITSFDEKKIGRGDLMTPEEIDFFKKIYSKIKPNVVVANYVWLAKIFDEMHDNRLKVILTHDVIFKRVESERKMGQQWHNPYWNRDREANE